MISYIVIALFIWSKFFYISLFDISQFNFTLSDLCILIMLADVFIKSVGKQEERVFQTGKFHLCQFLLSLTVLAVSTLGCVFCGTSAFSGVIIFIKRWLSMLIIPFYMYINFQKRDIVKILYILFVVIVIFTVDNFNEMMSSMDSDRFHETINPNVLGMVVSILLLAIIFYKKESLSQLTVSFVMLCICGALLILVSSRGAIFAFFPVLLWGIIKHNLTFKYNEFPRIIIIFLLGMILIPIILYIVQNTFTYSYDRIMGTLTEGILKDPSAASRLKTQHHIINLIKKDPRTLFFGVGFGNIGTFFKKYNLNTADSQYYDIIAWSGIIGFVIFFAIIFRYNKRRNLEKTSFSNIMGYINLYMLLAGISQDCFTEPTIGAIYFLALGIYEISRKEQNAVIVQEE